MTDDGNRPFLLRRTTLTVIFYAMFVLTVLGVVDALGTREENVDPVLPVAFAILTHAFAKLLAADRKSGG